MIIGIDIGTSTCSASFMDGSGPSIIPNSYGFAVTPAVIAWSDNTGLLVGNSAEKQSITDYGRTVRNIKRRIGTAFPVQLGDRIFTPLEITGFIIKKVVKDAEDFLKQPVTGAVLTVPAHFSQTQRKATVNAAEAAGLSSVKLISEPAAAALAWGSRISGPCAVFDFGGGTLDIAILTVHGDECTVKGVYGDAFLGGADFTSRMFSLILKKIQPGFQLDDQYRALLQAKAEEAKITLSSSREAVISLPGHGDIRITRQEYEKAVASLIKRAVKVMDEALIQNGWRREDIGTLVLAGGSCRIPAVQEGIQAFMGNKVRIRTSPSEVVALGAAAAVPLMGKGRRVREVLPYDFGIEIDGGKTLRLASRNTPLPLKVKKVFTTVSDNQQTVEINLLQGSFLDALRNRSLGKVQLNSIRPAPKGSPKVEVEFSINADGILHLKARDAETDTSRELCFSTASRREPGIAVLMERVRKESRRFRTRIDATLKEDIDDILNISASILKGGSRGWEKECAIALKTILREIRGLSMEREADCAG